MCLAFTLDELSHSVKFTENEKKIGGVLDWEQEKAEPGSGSSSIGMLSIPISFKLLANSS